MLESKGRPLAPGDVMVLVRRRNDFGRALVRALKSRGVPVAGLDRLMLTEQPAVQDLMALADALLLPQDDLTFACLLTSPLGGLSDDSLMELAIGRRGPSVGDAARAGRRSGRTGRRPGRSSPPCCRASTTSRRTRCSPRRSARSAAGRGCIARLGPEAAEPVDELLNAALAYGRMHPPSLQGFLHWLRRSGAEVKREAEGAGSLVRVMTVHGAKGLQAPLVILPDTTSLPPDEGSILWATDPATGRDGADLVAAAGAALRRRPAPARCGGAAADGGAQPAALRRADPRRGPAGGVRLADAARAGRCVLVPAGRTRLRRACRRSARRSTAGTASCGATPRRSIAKPDRRHARRRGRRSPAAAALGRHGAGLARRAAAARTGPAGARWRPAGRRASNLGRCRPPPRRWRRARRRATGSSAAQLIHALLQHLPDLPPARRAAAALRLARSARQRSCRRRGRDARRARCWRSSTIRSWRRCSARAAAPRCR